MFCFILSTRIDAQHIAVSQYMVVKTINELFQMIIKDTYQEVFLLEVDEDIHKGEV